MTTCALVMQTSCVFSFWGHDITKILAFPWCPIKYHCQWQISLSPGLMSWVKLAHWQRLVWLDLLTHSAGYLLIIILLQNLGEGWEGYQIALFSIFYIKACTFILFMLNTSMCIFHMCTVAYTHPCTHAHAHKSRLQVQYHNTHTPTIYRHNLTHIYHLQVQSVKSLQLFFILWRWNFLIMPGH